jgi:hypothetical protein
MLCILRIRACEKPYEGEKVHYVGTWGKREVLISTIPTSCPCWEQETSPRKEQLNKGQKKKKKKKRGGV